MTTETAVKIARCEAFYRRVEFFAIKAAIAKLNEETPEPADVLLAQSVLDGMENMVIWSLATLTNSTIMVDQFYEYLVRKDPNNKGYINGWKKR